MWQTLLDRNNSPLNNLRVHRAMLDSKSPYCTWEHTPHEMALYALTGIITVYWNGSCLGQIGGRKSVTERVCHVIRFPRLCVEDGHKIVLTLEGFAADALLIECVPSPEEDTMLIGPTLPYFHYNDTVWNDVGSGSYARRVAEVQTPAGFELYLGETLNEVGGVSSWPAHANEHDLQLYKDGQTDWEEGMFFICPKPGLCIMDGIMSDGQLHRRTQVIENGSAHAMPLGSHRIQAAPDAWLWYAWFYAGNALQKQYRKFSTDVGIYVK